MMSRTIRVSAADRTLFHVAGRELNDSTQWWRIARANGLSDPDLSWLTAPVPIIIPIVDETMNGGLPGISE